MDDRTIIELFFARKEEAIAALEAQYGSYMNYIAAQILKSVEDAEECVNDALFTVWNRIPPDDPKELRLFCGAVARNAALSRLQKKTAGKRDPALLTSLEEYGECLPDAGKTEESILDEMQFKKAFNGFLESLSKERRVIFLQRYYFNCSLPEIARRAGKSEKSVKSLLFRLRKELKKHLEKEGIFT